MTLWQAPRGRWITSRADNFGAWYHFWGAMLAAYAYEAVRVPMLPVPGHWVAKWMILHEEFIVSPAEWIIAGAWRAFFDQHKRLEIDLQGTVAGGRLAVLLRQMRRDPAAWRHGRREADGSYLQIKPARFRIMRTLLEVAVSVATLAGLVGIVLVVQAPLFYLYALLTLMSMLLWPLSWGLFQFALVAYAALSSVVMYLIATTP